MKHYFLTFTTFLFLSALLVTGACSDDDSSHNLGAEPDAGDAQPDLGDGNEVCTVAPCPVVSGAECDSAAYVRADDGCNVCECTDGEYSCSRLTCGSGPVFVRVEDLGEDGGGMYAGTDLDAIELLKADGTVVYADLVHDLETDSPAAADPGMALGEPDIGLDCVPASERFFSMGNGFVVVSFGTHRLEAGDIIRVHTWANVDECAGQHLYQPVNLLVAEFPDGPWTTLCTEHERGDCLVQGL